MDLGVYAEKRMAGVYPAKAEESPKPVTFEEVIGRRRDLLDRLKSEFLNLISLSLLYKEKADQVKMEYMSLDRSLAFLDGRYHVIKSEKKKKKQKLSKRDLLDILASLEEGGE